MVSEALLDIQVQPTTWQILTNITSLKLWFGFGRKLSEKYFMPSPFSVRFIVAAKLGPDVTAVSLSRKSVISLAIILHPSSCRAKGATTFPA
jgi:hypothetical protein